MPRTLVWLLIVLTSSSQGLCCCSAAAVARLFACGGDGALAAAACPGCAARGAVLRSQPSRGPVVAKDSVSPASQLSPESSCRCRPSSPALYERSTAGDDVLDVMSLECGLAAVGRPPLSSDQRLVGVGGPLCGPPGGRALLCRLQRLLI